MFIPVIHKKHLIAVFIHLLCIQSLLGRSLPKEIIDNGKSPWPSLVENHLAVQPGEHPRLLFRRSDIEKLRAKADTQLGRSIIRRLREQLDGKNGESMPSHLELPDNAKGWPSGGFSISHVAGYGMLYQLTGDKKYAELGKKCFEASLAGAPTCDKRYSFKNPGGALRAGPTLGWHSLGYDLCYNGWDESYRRKIASVIENYHQGKWCSLSELARGERQHPGSNHWGMQIGGAALALLAIHGDPGVNTSRIEPWLKENENAMKINMTQGFGSAGFFAEGDGTGSMASHISFLTAIQAYKNVLGKDYYTPRPNAQWMMLKWFFLTALGGDPADLRASFPERGGYPHNIWARDGISGGGYFAIGFGVADDAQKAAMKWFYRYSGLESLDSTHGFGLDGPSGYPHHSLLALVNWPFEMPSVNPGTVLPKAIHDDRWQFYAWRNRWQDEQDVIISILPEGAKGNMGAKAEESLTIQYAGQTMKWGNIRDGITDTLAQAEDGSTILTTGDGSCLAIDFSGTSGADAMLVMTGPGAPKQHQYVHDGNYFSLLFLGGKMHEPKVTENGIQVGEQVISHQSGTIELKQFNGQHSVHPFDN